MNLVEKLREAKIKVTPQRILILKIMSNYRGKHVTAEEIYNKIKSDIPSISISTVYRTLKQLEEKGIVSSLAVPSAYGLTLFDSNFEEHHHFICKHCGKIQDIPKQDISVNIHKKAKWRGENISVIIKGLCEGCEGK